MPAVDGARARVERLMTDSCVVTSDVLRLSDAELDEDTLELIPNVANDKVIYRGKCYLAKKSSRQRSNDAGMMVAESTYFFAIPFTGKLLREGLIVDITRATDPALKGRRFTITEIDMGSIQVWRSATVQLVSTDRG